MHYAKAAVVQAQEAAASANAKATLSARQASKRFNVPRTTLQDRLSGGLSRQEAHDHQMNLTPAQEQVLEDWIAALGAHGVGISPKLINEKASAIRGKDVGESFYQKFLSKHSRLKNRVARPLEECRAKNLNPTLVSECYNVLEQLITKYNIPPHHPTWRV